MLSSCVLSCEAYALMGRNMFKQAEVRPDRGNCFATLLDGPFVDWPQPIISSGQIRHLRWVDAHNSTAGGVNSSQITPHHQYTSLLRSAHDRTISFHPNNAIHNGKMRL